MTDTGGQVGEQASEQAGEGGKALSIRDVARIAGVSRQTVSRVLNRQPNIKPSTEAHVRQVIEEVG
ncbi:MAG TPA: LacI family DNA-binding transcriptional regulator, partial [Pseudolysinimonas sp.]